MNTCYRLIWNEVARTWVAVSEIAKTRSKRAAVALLLAATGVAVAAPPNPPAPTRLPTGGQVVAGTASIAQSGALMNINQSSQRAAIDWQTFNVGSAAQLNFNQPGTGSVTLNRVLDSNPSQIFGKISAPGQVFLTNPGGVYFAPGASVDVGALVATTHSLSNNDFMAGNYTFSRHGATGSIVNEGNLTASPGAYIALLAPEVRNRGVIVAQLGTVALAAGETYQLQFDSSNTLANILVTAATMRALVENGHAVQAPGGLVILSAQAADQLQGSVVNNSGAIVAQGMTSNGGVIRLDAGNGQTGVTGTLDASSTVGTGGRIVVTGEAVHIGDAAHLTASGKSGGGEVLVGGSWQNTDAAVRQAITTTVAKTALLEASATEVGAGGTLTVWSDVANPNSATRAYGTLLAKGGDNGGDGGRIETSGHSVDTAGASVSAAAPRGKGGLWLIDPPGSTTITQAVADVYVATLNTGTSVLDNVAGSITTDSNVSIAKTLGGNATLTLKSTGSISFGSGTSISSTSGQLDTILSGNGGITLNSGSSINTGGGAIVMGGGTCSTAGCSAAAKGTGLGETGGIYLYGTSGGRVTLNSGGGAIKMWGEGPNNGGSGILFGYTSVDSGATGSVWLKGDGYYNNTAAYSNGHGIWLGDGASTIRGGSGGMTLIGSANTNGWGQWSYAIRLTSGSAAYTTNGGLL
ncbi:MAG: filamentous hemagglutinin N-terminal domain-containing protein, partial [Rhodoferax sp.]|uniref:two-partner secretion domain-containing protein n=1 Tax=Rhodoferax sp. TaxID=50421 RepID=UPI00261A5C21